MKNKVKVNLKDKYRVLMTELLPYELPLWFTNDLMYERFNDNEDFLNDIIKSNQKKKKYYIPLDFKICRTGNSVRILSIMHPSIQKQFCNFYDKYQDLIIYYCGLSKQSLRYPVKTVGSFFKRTTSETSKHTTGIEDQEQDHKNFISFFKYKKFAFLYKFFESYDYNKLEKRYKYMLQVDVSKCFHNIYTHSISWAIKNKFIAKRDSGKNSFDYEFDKIMEKSNYSETNGIIIGPEISRIFAEIIFQNIDRKIILNLKKRETRIRIKYDYDFRRYLDDYFIYFNDDTTKEHIIDAINAELFHYKMHLNEAKTVLLKRPFITDITVCKMDLSRLIDNKIYQERYDEKNEKKQAVNNSIDETNKLASKLKTLLKDSEEVNCLSISNYCTSPLSILFKNITEFISMDKKVKTNKKNKKIKTVNNPGRKANKIISELKKVIKTHEKVDYSSISNYCISILSTKINNFISDNKELGLDEEMEKKFINWLLIDIDIIFFIHAMDPRIVTTDKIVRILLKIINIESCISEGNYDLIIKKIYDSSIDAIKIFENRTDIIYPVEILNLLLLLSKIKNKFKLEEKFIREMFSLEKKEEHKDDKKESHKHRDEIQDKEKPFYFLWVSLMLYIRDDNEYLSLKQELIKKAESFFNKNKHKFQSSEFLMFWGDFLACPYVDEETKKKIITNNAIITSDNKAKSYIQKNFGKKKGIIIDWDESDWLSKNIEKRIFQNAYE